MVADLFVFVCSDIGLVEQIERELLLHHVRDPNYSRRVLAPREGDAARLYTLVNRLHEAEFRAANFR